MQRDDRPATQAQIDFIHWLIQETKTDPKWLYGIELCTRRKAQEVIDILSEGVDVSKWEG